MTSRRRLAAALVAIGFAHAAPAFADGPDDVAPTVVLEAGGTITPSVEGGDTVPEEPAGDASVSVWVRDPDAVDPDALQAALEDDLGVRVEIVRPDDAGAARVIVELTGDDRVRLRVRREGAPPLTRETAPDATRAGTTITVSLLLANLVRDESADLLSMLEPPPAEPEPPIVVVVPVEVPPEEPEVEPEPVVEPTPEIAPAPRPWIFAGIDFVPGLGVSTAFLGGERRTLSVGVIGGWTGGIDGVGVSSVLDLSLGTVRGVQAAGVYGHAHEVRGLQVAGVAAGSESRIGGVQAAGVVSVGGRVDGAQFAGVLALSTEDVHGVQLSGVTSLTGAVHGIQAASVLNVAARGVYGAQLGMINVSADRVRGAQLGLANISGPTSGAQTGLVNVATEVDGAQLGLVNVAGRVRGVQLGLFNIAERSDAAIGLFSLNTQGAHHLRTEASSAGFLSASYVNRGAVTYSLLTVSVNPFLGPVGGIGLGFGVRAQPLDVFHLDVEVVAHALFHDRLDRDAVDGLFEARVLGGIHIFDGFTLLLGVGFQTMLTSDPDPPDIATMPIVFDETVNRGSRVRGWPSLHAGLEFF